MDQAAFDAAIAGTTEQRDVSAREVQGGYVLTGVRRFLEPGTASVKLAQNIESVASSQADAATKVATFITTGAFA